MISDRYFSSVAGQVSSAKFNQVFWKKEIIRFSMEELGRVKYLRETWLTHLFPMFCFDSLWKPRETRSFSDVFRGHQKDLCVSGGLNGRFSENLVCFVFLKHLFWDSPFCLITDVLCYHMLCVLSIEFKSFYFVLWSWVIFIFEPASVEWPMKFSYPLLVFLKFSSIFEKDLSS